VTLAAAAGHGASRSVDYVAGGTSETITFPKGSLPSTFTLCSITRCQRVDPGSDLILGSVHLEYDSATNATKITTQSYKIIDGQSCVK
jgi:hypothetical protein